KRVELGPGVLDHAIPQPCNNRNHTEPTQGAQGAPDFPILKKQSPLAEENRPVACVGSHQRQSLCPRIRHVGADIRKIFKEPETRESKTGSLSLPEKISSAERWHDQLSKRAANNVHGFTEPTEEKMSAFMDDEVDVIEKKESGAVRPSVKKKKRISEQPSNAHPARNGLPFAQAVFQEGHSLKRNKRASSPERRLRIPVSMAEAEA